MRCHSLLRQLGLWMAGSCVKKCELDPAVNRTVEGLQMIAAGKLFKGYILAALPCRFLFWGRPPSPLPFPLSSPSVLSFSPPPPHHRHLPSRFWSFSVPTPRTAKWEVSEIFFVPKIISFIMVICGILPSLSLCNLRYYFINEHCEIWGSSALEAGVCDMLQRLQFYTRIPSSNIFPSYILYTYIRGHKNVHICYFTCFTCYPFILKLLINALCFCLYSRCALTVVSVFLGFFITLTFSWSVIDQLCYIPNTARWWKYKEDTNRPVLKVIAF